MICKRTITMVKVELGVMAMKVYSIFPKAPGLEPHRQM